jgi:hypothetical protein
MGWFARLFASQQVRDCRFALNALDDRFGSEWAWPELKVSISRAIAMHEKQVRTRMIVGAESPVDVVQDMIAITCLNDIETGRHHVYRGVLNQQGQSKRNIYAGILTDQLRNGRITLQEAAVANENMKSAVAGAG